MSGIILTTDLSEESKRAFAPTLDLARKLELRITLLSVLVELQIAPHGTMLAATAPYPDVEEIKSERIAKLTAMAQEFGDDVRVEAVVVEGSSAATSIVEYANQQDADFIAISTHGRTGLRRLVMGSVAEAVLRHAETPVICFPTRQEKGRDQ